MSLIEKDNRLNMIEEELSIKKEIVETYESLLKNNKKVFINICFVWCATFILAIILIMDLYPMNIVNVVSTCFLMITLNNLIRDYKSRKNRYELELIKINIEIKHLEKTTKKLRGEW